jgi:hypothetical protein
VTVDVSLEVGKKRVFAGAIDWLGWCRSGKDRDEALQVLLDYGTRYSKVLRGRRLGFTAPKALSAFNVVERLEGDASTDFGVPGQVPKSDRRPVGQADVKRMQAILRGCWAALDAAVDAASGKALRKGPRGGGRDLDKIVQHVLDADAGYLSRIDVKYRIDGKAELKAEMATVRSVIIDTLPSLVGSAPVKKGPRGGVRWPPRYFVRRTAWHVLDHAWEIEDRIT